MFVITCVDIFTLRLMKVKICKTRYERYHQVQASREHVPQSNAVCPQVHREGSRGGWDGAGCSPRFEVLVWGSSETRLNSRTEELWPRCVPNYQEADVQGRDSRLGNSRHHATNSLFKTVGKLGGNIYCISVSHLQVFRTLRKFLLLSILMPLKYSMASTATKAALWISQIHPCCKVLRYNLCSFCGAYILVLVQRWSFRFESFLWFFKLEWFPNFLFPRFSLPLWGWYLGTLWKCKFSRSLCCCWSQGLYNSQISVSRGNFWYIGLDLYLVIHF